MHAASVQELGNEILATARTDLYLSMRFLDVALSGLSYEVSPLITSTATDGNSLYFQPKYLFSSYEENPILINRAYMHNLLHCLFSHLYLTPEQDEELWGLCCDICVESIIDSLDVSPLRKMNSPLREQTYAYLNHSLKLYTPARVYQCLEGSIFYQQNLPLLLQDFHIDCHDFWPKKETKKEGHKKQQEKWQELGTKTKTNMETFERRAGKNAGHLLETLRITQQSSLPYDQFLKRFAAWREIIKVNEDEFDTAYYMLGLSLYDNIPFIEPLEYKEEKKIKHLVIAIDTSGSVRGVPVQKFLSETFAILQHSSSFFEHIHVHILQFDTVVQDDSVITSLEQFKTMTESFTLRGFGGTDYRCVFDYIKKKQESGIPYPLQGLLILTDGYGTYPEKNPGYPTAFLLADFLKETPGHAPIPCYDTIPAWAIRLRIDERSYHE